MAIRLTTSRTQQNGSFRFKLVAPDGTESPLIEVTDILAGTSAIDKATLIRNNIETDAGNNWRALRDGNTLTFQHKEGGEWKDVGKIKDIRDMTGEEEVISTTAALPGDFDFGLAAGVASGRNPAGRQSRLSIVSSFGRASVRIAVQSRSRAVIDSLFVELQRRGANVRRTSPLTIRVRDESHPAFIQYRVSDTSLAISGAGGVELRRTRRRKVAKGTSSPKK